MFPNYHQPPHDSTFTLWISISLLEPTISFNCGTKINESGCAMTSVSALRGVRLPLFNPQSPHHRLQFPAIATRNSNHGFRSNGFRLLARYSPAQDLFSSRLQSRVAFFFFFFFFLFIWACLFRKTIEIDCLFIIFSYFSFWFGSDCVCWIFHRIFRLECWTIGIKISIRAVYSSRESCMLGKKEKKSTSLLLKLTARLPTYGIK